MGCSARSAVRCSSARASGETVCELDQASEVWAPLGELRRAKAREAAETKNPSEIAASKTQDAIERDILRISGLPAAKSSQAKGTEHKKKADPKRPAVSKPRLGKPTATKI